MSKLEYLFLLGIFTCVTLTKQYELVVYDLIVLLTVIYFN